MWADLRKRLSVVLAGRRCFPNSCALDVPWALTRALVSGAGAAELTRRRRRSLRRWPSSRASVEDPPATPALGVGSNPCRVVLDRGVWRCSARLAVDRPDSWLDPFQQPGGDGAGGAGDADPAYPVNCLVMCIVLPSGSAGTWLPDPPQTRSTVRDSSDRRVRCPSPCRPVSCGGAPRAGRCQPPGRSRRRRPGRRAVSRRRSAPRRCWSAAWDGAAGRPHKPRLSGPGWRPR